MFNRLSSLGSLGRMLRSKGGFATLLGDIATLAQAGLPGTIEQGYTDSRVKVNLEKYTIGGSTETSGSTIDIGAPLPAGARVLAIELYVDTAQTALTFKLGDEADDDRYVAAGNTSLQTAGLYRFGGNLYQVGQTSGDRQILLTTGGATMTAGAFKAAVYYTMD